EEDTDADSIDYPDEPKDGEEDDDEDSDEDPEEDPSMKREPEDDDDDDDTNDEDEEPTEDEEEEEELALADSSMVLVVDPVPSARDTEAFETDESAPTPRLPQTRVPFSQTHLCRARKSVRFKPPMSASIEARITEHAAAPIPPTNPTYDQTPLGHMAAMIHIRDDILEEDMPPRRRFVLTAPPPSPGHDARTIARSADRAEDVSYVRALQTSKHRMMTSIEEVNLRVSYQAQVRRKEMRGQRTAYETELHEIRQAYLSFETRNMALLAQLETLDTHMSRMEWQRQRDEDNAVRQIMCTQVLEARAQIDTMEDAGKEKSERHVAPARVCSYPDFMKCQPLNFKGTEGVVGLSQWIKKMESVFHISGCAIENQVKFATCTLLGDVLTWEIKKLKIELWNLKVRGNDVAAYTQRFQELALMCTKFLADETAKIDKYIGGLPDNIHGNVMSARPKTLDFAIELKLANDLMDQKLHTYAERQNDNKRKADDSSRNNQQPYKKQNVARAYTAGPGEKKVYTGDLPLCTKCNYHHIGQCAPKCGKYKRYGHTTTDCRVNTNNNNKNQKIGACYECGNTGHIKKN
ncbi:hypothetical protein Tco_1420699, partial [Tanacetum coccineum]